MTAPRFVELWPDVWVNPAQVAMVWADEGGWSVVVFGNGGRELVGRSVAEVLELLGGEAAVTA